MYGWVRPPLVVEGESIVSQNLLTYMEVFGLGFVTGKLPQYFTKPDIWHLGLNLNVSRSFSAAVSFNPRVVCLHFGRKKLL